MGFWSKFGKIGAAVAPFAAMAIPGVGPALGTALKAGGIGSKILAAAPAASQIIGGIAKGRSEGRQTEAALNQNQDQTRQRMYEALVNAQINQAKLGADRAQFERDSPSVRFQQALKGGAAANMQDVGIQAPGNVQSHLVNFTGGARPSAIGPQGRQAGRTLADLALASMGKDTFSVPELPQQPGLTPTPKAGAIDKILGAAGPATAILGMFGGGEPSLLEKYGKPQGPIGPQLGPADVALGQQNSPDLLLPNVDPNDPRLRMFGQPGGY